MTRLLIAVLVLAALASSARAFMLLSPTVSSSPFTACKTVVVSANSTAFLSTINNVILVKNGC